MLVRQFLSELGEIAVSIVNSVLPETKKPEPEVDALELLDELSAEAAEPAYAKRLLAIGYISDKPEDIYDPKYDRIPECLIDPIQCTILQSPITVNEKNKNHTFDRATLRESLVNLRNSKLAYPQSDLQINKTPYNVIIKKLRKDIAKKKQVEDFVSSLERIHKLTTALNKDYPQWLESFNSHDKINSQDELVSSSHSISSNSYSKEFHQFYAELAVLSHPAMLLPRLKESKLAIELLVEAQYFVNLVTKLINEDPVDIEDKVKDIDASTLQAKFDEIEKICEEKNNWIEKLTSFLKYNFEKELIENATQIHSSKRKLEEVNFRLANLTKFAEQISDENNLTTIEKKLLKSKLESSYNQEILQIKLELEDERILGKKHTSMFILLGKEYMQSSVLEEKFEKELKEVFDYLYLESEKFLEEESSKYVIIQPIENPATINIKEETISTNEFIKQYLEEWATTASAQPAALQDDWSNLPVNLTVNLAVNYKPEYKVPNFLSKDTQNKKVSLDAELEEIALPLQQNENLSNSSNSSNASAVRPGRSFPGLRE